MAIKKIKISLLYVLFIIEIGFSITVNAKNPYIVFINLNKQQEIKKYSYDKVSIKPLVDLKEESRQLIVEKLTNSPININSTTKNFKIGNLCSFNFILIEISPLKYWHSVKTIQYYKNELLKLGIKMPAVLQIYQSSNPYKICDEPSSEYILINNKIIFIYKGYLIVYKQNNEKLSKQSKSFKTIIYDQKVDLKTVVFKKIRTTSITGINSLSCLEDSIRYIDLPSKADVKLLLVPQDCGDFKYRFYLVTLKNNTLVSKIYVEGIWYEPDNNEEEEITSFKIFNDFSFEVKTIKKNISFNKEYTMNSEGFITLTN